jgi:uncharacterized protein (TIGR02246 family)
MEISKITKENFEMWNDAIQTKDPVRVSKIYREDCLFLPTFPQKGKEIVSKNGVGDYFNHFLLKSPKGTIIEESSRSCGLDVIIHAGKYDFEIGPDGDRSIVHAKFTFIWKLEDNEWKILLHDSSPLNQ